MESIARLLVFDVSRHVWSTYLTRLIMGTQFSHQGVQKLSGHIPCFSRIDSVLPPLLANNHGNWHSLDLSNLLAAVLGWTLGGDVWSNSLFLSLCCARGEASY